MSYQFLDAYGSVLTADSSFVFGVIQRPIINVGSIIGDVTATISGGSFSPGSVSGVGVFNINPTGNGSVISVGQVTRNDTIASFVGVTLTPRYMAGDSAGRVLVKPFAPEEARVQSVIATTTTTSTSVLAAGGAGLRTYITNIFVTNTGSVATLVNFLDGDNSVMGRTIAPATGGSNMNMTTPMRTGGPAQQVHITTGTPVSTLGVTALGYYAP